MGSLDLYPVLLTFHSNLSSFHYIVRLFELPILSSVIFFKGGGPQIKISNVIKNFFIIHI